MKKQVTKVRLSGPDPLQRRALRILKGTADFSDRFVPDHKELVDLVEILRSMGCGIAFVSGVWDLFHTGHGRYIALGKKEAYKFCPDVEQMILIVGLDSDELTRSRKGPDRPAVPEDERAETLGFMRSVDIITPQYEADQLYKVIKHDVRIVSTSTKDLPGLAKIKKQCREIVNLPPQAETSTSAKLRKIMLTGAMDALERIKPKLDEALGEIDKVMKEIRDDSNS